MGSLSAWAAYGGRALWAVGPVSTVACWTTTPLWKTVARAGRVSLPSLSKRGASQTMSYVCHYPGGREALTRGGLWP